MEIDRYIAVLFVRNRKRYSKTFCLLAICIFIVQETFSQTIIDLDRAYAILNEQNITLSQLRLSKELSEQDVKDAKNILLPTVGLGASRNYNLGLAFDQVSGQLVTGNRWSNTANVNINTQVTIFQGFALRNQIRHSLISLEMREVEILGLKRSLKIELLSLFFSAITNRSLYESSLEQLAFSKEQLVQQQEQFELGTKTLVDVSIAESQVATDELNALVSDNAYKSMLTEIKQFLQIPYTDSIVPVAPEVNLRGEFTTFQHIPPILGNNPFVRQVQLGIDQANLAIRMAKNNYFPTLNFSGGYGTNYSSERRDFFTGDYMPFWNQVNQNRALYFGLSLSVPVFDGFRTRGMVSRANVQLHMQRHELEKVKAEQKRIYIQALQEYDKAQKEYLVTQTKHQSLKRALEAMTERYNLGVASSMDFSKSILDHNLAEFNMISAKYSLLYSIEVLKVLNNIE